MMPTQLESMKPSFRAPPSSCLRRAGPTSGTEETSAWFSGEVEGNPALDKLDLVGQTRMTALTLRWLRLFLRAAWFKTDPVRAHVKRFFPEFDFAPEGHEDDALLETLRTADASVRDYFCYLLLDFAAVDPELEHEPLSAAFALTTLLAWDERLEALVVKELKVKKREAQRLRAGARAADPPGQTAEVLE